MMESDQLSPSSIYKMMESGSLSPSSINKLMESRSVYSPTPQRRIKNIVPSTDKDDRYWEKRKRNNLAAKKSRENRRVHENEVKDRVQILEEENALLKKELEVIKERYNIPKHSSALSSSQRDECLHEFWKLNNTPCSSSRNTYERSNTHYECTSNKYECSTTMSRLQDAESFNSEIENPSKNERSAENGEVIPREPVSNVVWAVTPAHSHSLRHYAEGSQRYRNEMKASEESMYLVAGYSTSGHNFSNKRNHLCSDNDSMMPADLSTKRNPNMQTKNAYSASNRELRNTVRSQENNYDDAKTIYPGINTDQSPAYLSLCSNNTIANTEHKLNAEPKSPNRNSIAEHSGDNIEEVSSDMVDSADETDFTNSQIKCKLQLLSDQVERMQKLVCNTSN